MSQMLPGLTDPGVDPGDLIFGVGGFGMGFLIGRMIGQVIAGNIGGILLAVIGGVALGWVGMRRVPEMIESY